MRRILFICLLLYSVTHYSKGQELTTQAKQSVFDEHYLSGLGFMTIRLDTASVSFDNLIKKNKLDYINKPKSNLHAKEDNGIELLINDGVDYQLKDAEKEKFKKVVVKKDLVGDFSELDSVAIHDFLKSKDIAGIENAGYSIDSTTSQKLLVSAETKVEAKFLKFNSDNLPENIEHDDIQSILAERQAELKLKKDVLRNDLKQKLTSSAQNFISANNDKIQQFQSDVAALKKKYSEVPNSNDLSTARKRTSLKGDPLWQRLVIGGDFNVVKTNPLSLDLSPVLGYKINKIFEAGVSGSYRTLLEVNKAGISDTSNNPYGFGLFANHMVYKNFFGQLEGNRTKTTNGTIERPQRVWQSSLLIGVGRELKITNWLKMRAVVMFNLFHDNLKSPYGSPVIFKTGIRI